MTPELYPPAPRLVQWVPCPVCNMLFKDPQGRGGHLRHTRDPAHTAYRAQHGLAKPKHSRYPTEATSAPPAPQARAPPPDEPETWVMEEPTELRPLIEPDELDLEAPATSPPSPGLPVSSLEATAPPALPPASPAQALRLASPQAANGYGGFSEAGEAPRQGDSNASGQAPASAPQVLAFQSPASQAMPASSVPAASPSPALPAQAVRLALPEAPKGYGESGEAGEAGRQTASTEARRPRVGAPAPSPGSPAVPVSPGKGPEVDWSDPKNAKAGLRILGGALARPPGRMHWVGRVICCGIAVVIVGWPLWELVKELKAANRNSEPYVMDASKLTAGPPSRKTGDPYWDHLLGYGGHP